MRKITPAIFVILILGLLIVSSACVSSPPGEKNTRPGEVSSVTQPSESHYISFDTALQNLPAYQPDPANASFFTRPIYYFTGINVNGSGDAKNWIFGVRSTSGTEMLAYDRNGWTTIPWNAPPGSKEIAVDQIVRPEQLFSQNMAVIINNPSSTVPGKSDIELKQGNYTLTITSGDMNRILTFNATTGELIP